MMGTRSRAFAPLGDRSLEALVPADNLYRRLQRVLDLSFVHDLVVDRYAVGGRPSVDPVVFFTLQLVMFLEGIRSERQLMRVVADRFSVRCGRPPGSIGYDLDEPWPDHSSLTRIRDRYGLAIFRRFFAVIVERCIAAGLVWGKELFFDASKVEANASPDSMIPRFAVEAHLAARFAQASDPSPGKETETPVPLPVLVSETTQADLAVTNEARHDWIAAEGAQQRAVVSKDYHRISDRKASTTDPMRP
jgi:transposase